MTLPADGGAGMKRPMAVLGFTLGGALLTASLAGFHLAILGAVLGLAGLTAALSVKRLRRLTYIPAICFAGAVGFILFAVKDYREAQPLEGMAGRTVYIEGQMVDSGYGAGGGAGGWVTLEVTAGDLPRGTRLDVWVSIDNLPALWDMAAGEVKLRGFTDGAQARTARGQGQYLSGTPAEWDGMRVWRTARRPWNAAFTDARNRLSDTVGRYVQGDAGALVRGVAFGDTRLLSAGARADFRGAGMSHLTAISGQHLVVLAAALLALLRKCRIPARAAAIAVMPLTVGFVLLVGAPMSAVRAAVMCLVMLAGMAARREADALNSLGLSVLLIGVAQPFAAYDAGLLLSVAAVLGLILLYPLLLGKRQPAGRLGRRLLPVKKGVCAGAAASLSTMPVLAAVFGTLSVVAPVSNLLAVFPASLLMGVGGIATLLALVPGLGWAAKAVFLPARWLALYLLAVARTTAALPFAEVLARYAYITVWAFAAPVLIFAAGRLRGRRGAWRMLAVCLSIVLGGTVLLQVGMRGVLTVTAADTRRGTAILLERDGHRAAVLGDGGDVRDLIALCRARRIKRLELVIASGIDERRATDLRLAVEVGDFIIPAEGETVTFWGDGRAQARGGWTRVDVGGREVLLCADGGDASALPADWRHPALVIVGVKTPQGMTGITAAAGVLACRAADEPAGVPWGAYPMRRTAEEGDIEFRYR